MKRYNSKFGIEIMMLLTFVFGGIIVFMIFKKEPLEAILSVGGIFLC